MLSTSTTPPIALNRYLHFPQFLSIEEQKKLASATLQLHSQNEELAPSNKNDDDPPREREPTAEWDGLKTSRRSKALNLHLHHCGASLHNNLPIAVQYAHKVFERAINLYMESGDPRTSQYAEEISTLVGGRRHHPLQKGEDDADVGKISRQIEGKEALTGLALMYGQEASMPPHYDSPTQKNQKSEWLCMFSMGHAIRFRCNDEILQVRSGDALVMDSMSVFHGVQSVDGQDCCIDDEFDFPIPGARLGVLLWKAVSDDYAVDGTVIHEKENDLSMVDMEGLSSLFPDSDDSDYGD